jgi:hypothetical protein
MRNSGSVTDSSNDERAVSDGGTHSEVKMKGKVLDSTCLSYY